MKKIMICMAFFGMLIGNGQAGEANNAERLLDVLNEANLYGILDKLTALNTDAIEGVVTAKEVHDDESGTYKDLKGKLIETNGFGYNDKGYYLIGGKSDGFEKLIIENLSQELKELGTSTLSTLEQYDHIIGLFKSSEQYEKELKPMVKEGVTCATGKEKNVQEKINKICKAINKQLKTKRVELLKKLLKETMLDKIQKLHDGENRSDVIKFAKDYMNEIFDHWSGTSPSFIIETDIETGEKYINILKGEVTEQLLSDVMDENKKAYNERIKYLDSIAKPAKVVTTTSPGGVSGSKPSVTPTVKKGSAAQRAASRLKQLMR